MRKFVALYGILVGGLHMLGMPFLQNITFFTAEIYGLALFTLGAPLLLTCNGGRRTNLGRIIAALNAGLYATLAFDNDIRATGFMFAVLAVYAMIAEAAAR